MKKYIPYLLPLVIIVGIILCLNFAMEKYQDSKFIPEVQTSNGDTGNPPDPAQSNPAQAADQGSKSDNAAPPKVMAGAIPILMYHEIGTGPSSLWVSTDKFRTQMNYLYKSGYHTVTMAEAQKLLVSGQIPAKTIVLTFDDGYVSCYTKAWPIMQEFGFSGTFYVCTSFVERPNYLTWEQIKTMQAAGSEIGSHTQNHFDLKTASSTVQSEEILGSKKILEEKLGVPIKSFCYPSGAYNDNVVKVVKESGYTSATTVAYGHATPKSNFMLIPRVRVPGWILLDNFIKNIQL